MARLPALLALGATAAVALGIGIGAPVAIERVAHPNQAIERAELPVAADGAVSRALGREQRAYRALAVGGGFRLRNVEQALTARLGRRGVEVSSGHAQLGLQLVAYGYGGALRPVAAASPQAAANRVSYARGALLEWYANGPLGLEQGFTLDAPPSHAAAGRLTLALKLSGNVATKRSHGTVTFTAGGASLAYRDLVVSDATGKRLPARVALAHGRLLIRINDAGARYPLRVDPFIQQATLTDSDDATADGFGTPLAISGNTIAVDASSENNGVVDVFVEPAGGWTSASETAQLTASDGVAGDQLGSSLAIDADTIVAGAQSATVGGNTDQGAAYVFVKPADGWTSTTEAAKLTASDGGAGGGFGRAVALSGDTVAVAGSGAVYVFAKPAGGWTNSTQTAKLTTSDAGFIGQSVAIGGIRRPGDTVVAGAAGGSGPGAVYVFTEPFAGWHNTTQSAKLTMSVSGYFSLGLSVAVSADADTVVASSATRGVGRGTPAPPQGLFVFFRTEPGWTSMTTPTALLTASNGDGLSAFAISGSTIIAGDPNATVAGNAGQGVVDVFTEPAGGWVNATESSQLSASDGEAGDDFGFSVAISGSTIATPALGGPEPSAYVFGRGADTTPPTTSITLDPPEPSGQDGWYTAPVNVAVSAVDDPGGSGVAATNCVLDPPGAPASFDAIPSGCAFSAPGAAVASDGEHTLYAASEDAAGNEESPQSIGFMLDQTPPSVVCDAEPSYPLGGSGGPVSATITDATSGPASSSVAAPADVSSAGANAVPLTGFDNAGNSASTSCPYLVTQPPSFSSGSSTSVGMRAPFDFKVTTAGFPAPAITESGALPSGVTFQDNGDGTADLAGSAAPGSAGSYPVSLTAANSVGSQTQSFVLTVTPGSSTPAITSASSDTETFGVAFSFTIQTSGFPAPKVTKSGGLPAGVSFTDNGDGTATLSGTPSKSAIGAYSLTLTAKSSAGTASQTFTLTVTKAPTIKKVPTTTAAVGTPMNLTVSATGYTTPTLTASGLPPGLGLADNGNGTATISGTPASGAGGSYSVTVTATNALGSASATFTLKIDEGPAITSPASAAAAAGSPFSFQVTATGFPAPKFKKSGTLPKGISFAPSTATFSGTPKAGSAGSYVIAITATNSSDAVVQQLTLTVQ